MRTFLAVLFLMLLAVPVLADTSTAPLISAERLALAGGVNREFNTNLPGAASPLVASEWSAGIYGAYALTAPATDEKHVPKLALVGSGLYGFDSKLTRWSLGLRFTLFDGGK